MTEHLSLGNLVEPARILLARICCNMGARIGQSTVLSQKVHTSDPQIPETVTILQNSDAGKVFYHRIQEGLVFHFDIFHECGLVDHRKVAQSVIQAIEMYNMYRSLNNHYFEPSQKIYVKPDWFDVQTATGGGRITGSLDYGKKLSLRKAHENHVHLAGLLSHEDLACVFYIVEAVESAICDCGLQLRANEKLLHVENQGSGEADMSPYSDQSDSFLRDRQMSHDSPALQRQQFMQDAATLAEEMDSAKEVYELLTAIERGDGKKFHSLTGTPLQKELISQYLSGMGIIETKDNAPILTRYGSDLKEFLSRRLPDVESYIRRMYRLLKPYDTQPGRTKANRAIGTGGSGRRILCNTENINGEISLPETVQAAAHRLAANPGGVLRISWEDIRRSSRLIKCKSEICVLIDASASMAGQRINAAKYLVRHLLLSTPDRVSVVSFQEDKATIDLPFTRDYHAVQQSLKNINAIGSTPLGLGIKTCLTYLDKARPKNPLILLVTDGVATYADVSKDPIQDAISAAKLIKAKGYRFTCIGLRPHKDYLSKLVKAAGGSIYMLDELEKQALVRTAWQDHYTNA